MAINLDHDGRWLIIQCLDESTLFGSVEFQDLLFSFTVESREDAQIILDVPINDLVESVNYIREVVGALGSFFM